MSGDKLKSPTIITYNCKTCGEFAVIHSYNKVNSKCSFCFGSVEILETENDVEIVESIIRDGRNDNQRN